MEREEIKKKFQSLIDNCINIISDEKYEEDESLQHLKKDVLKLKTSFKMLCFTYENKETEIINEAFSTQEMLLACETSFVAHPIHLVIDTSRRKEISQHFKIDE
jgi:hypothetical protein